MLMPRDPRVLPYLWGAIKLQLSRDEMCILIRDGLPIIPAKKIIFTQEQLSEWIEDISRRSIIRFTENRGATISPHFAGDISDDCFIVTDLVVSLNQKGWDDIKLVRNALEVLVMSIIYSKMGPPKVFIPCPIDAWKINGVEIFKSENGLIFKKA